MPGSDFWLVDDGVHGGVGQPGHMDLMIDPRQAGVWQAITRWLSDALVDKVADGG